MLALRSQQRKRLARPAAIAMEALFVLPIFTLIIIGMVGISDLIVTEQLLDEASARAARTAALGGTEDQIRQSVCAVLGPQRSCHATIIITCQPCQQGQQGQQGNNCNSQQGQSWQNGNQNNWNGGYQSGNGGNKNWNSNNISPYYVQGNGGGNQQGNCGNQQGNCGNQQGNCGNQQGNCGNQQGNCGNQQGNCGSCCQIPIIWNGDQSSCRPGDLIQVQVQIEARYGTVTCFRPCSPCELLIGQSVFQCE